VDRHDLLRSIYVGLYDVFGASLKKMSQAVGEFGITPAQLGVLVNIPERGANMTDLIRKVGCAPSNMTSMIRRMERDGLVKTSRNPDDQRETLVHLTTTGVELLEKVRPAYLSFLETSYGHLSTAEQMMLCELLNKLR
jgi:DNA-binding MarR family transcriptional regulator